MKADYGTCPCCRKRVRLNEPLHTGQRPVGMHWEGGHPCGGVRLICVEDDAIDRRTRTEAE